MNFEFGDALSKYFATASVVVINILAGSWNWAYKMSGPVLLPLLALTVMGFWSVLRLFDCWKQTDDEIIEKARKKYGQKFDLLWAARARKEFLNDKAEEELCRMIAYYTNNQRQRTNHIFTVGYFFIKSDFN